MLPAPMADPETIRRLIAGGARREAVTSWNEWRAAHEGPIDLARAELRLTTLNGVDLRAVDLRGADLLGAKLCEAVLVDADLSGADLYKAQLWDADLAGADLRGANLRESMLLGANFERCDLSSGIFDGARYDRSTRWPEGFRAEGRGMIRVRRTKTGNAERLESDPED